MFSTKFSNFVFLTLGAIIFCFPKNNLKAVNTNYPKSYYGSILSGQIANYRNDSFLSADFFNYAIGILMWNFICAYSLRDNYIS